MGRRVTFVNFNPEPVNMTRTLLLFFLCSISLGTASAGAADRPHIVMAFADDWGRYASAYGKLVPGGINDVVCFDLEEKS